jgi:hypothetical protein
MDDNRVVPYKVIFIMRIAFGLGAVLFAAVSLWMRSQTPMDADPEFLSAMRLATFGFAAAAIGVALVIRSMREGKPTQVQVQYTIIGWAVGESTALLGGVQHFQGGSVPVMAIGFMAFATVFVLLPIPDSLR